MNNLIKNYEGVRADRGGSKKKKFDFKTCKCNTIKSLKETEYFLSHIHEISKYIKLYKIFK